jgi:hypothetical protein
MTKATATLIGLSSLTVLMLLGVYFLAEFGFCAGSLHGEFRGCFSAAAHNSAKSPVHMIGWPVAALGLFLAARATPRRRG